MTRIQTNMTAYFMINEMLLCSGHSCDRDTSSNGDAMTIQMNDTPAIAVEIIDMLKILLLKMSF